jgi:hypothetical protein
VHVIMVWPFQRGLSVLMCGSAQCNQEQRLERLERRHTPAAAAPIERPSPCPPPWGPPLCLPLTPCSPLHVPTPPQTP